MYSLFIYGFYRKSFFLLFNAHIFSIKCASFIGIFMFPARKTERAHELNFFLLV